MTKAALADAAGISTRSLSKYERGEAEASPFTIARLADALRFPVAFLYGDTLDEPTVDGVSFRSLSRLSARERDQSLASGALALRFADWIGERFDLPDPDVPRYDGIDPENAAEAVREQWGLGERPISNIVHLLEAHGVRAFSLVEECHDVDAFSFWRGSLPYVFLNTIKTVEHSRADAAHELGHLVIHAHGGPSGRAAEHEAHAFAAAFLMPRNSVLARVPRGATLSQIIAAKGHWKVAAVNLARRAHHLGLLTEWQYRNICIALSKRGRANEPRAIRKQETSQVLAKVLRALRDEQLSPASLARTLDIPADELSKSTFGLMLRSVEGDPRPAPVSAPTQRPALRVL